MYSCSHKILAVNSDIQKGGGGSLSIKVKVEEMRHKLTVLLVGP